MFLNKLAVCLYSRVAVRGKIFEPNGINELTLDLKSAKTSYGNLHRAESFGVKFVIKSALFEVVTKNNIFRTNSYDVLSPVVLTRMWLIRFAF